MRFSNTKFLSKQLDFLGRDLKSYEKRGVNFKNGDFLNCEFEGVFEFYDFSGANFINCKFNKNIFRDSCFHFASFTGCKLSEVDIIYLKGAKINLKNCEIDNCDFSGSLLRDSKFDRTLVINSRFIETNLVNAKWSRNRFINVIFRGSVFGEVMDNKKNKFVDCDFTRTDFKVN